MSSIIDGLRFSFRKNLDYGQRLVADLSEDQMCQQPCPPDRQPANHPAWALCHLNVYLPVIQGLIKGEEFEDPKPHRFGMDSRPELDRSIYPSREEIVRTFVDGHEEIDRLLAAVGPEILEQPVRLPRWQNLMPTAAHALPYLMLVHENIHLGQISAWRRIQGMASV